jgi:hypothetical protein
MVGLKDLTMLLERWPVWRAIAGTPARVDALEQKVAKLEKEIADLLGKRPGESCPACGERSMRAGKAYPRMGSFPSEYHYEDWRCEKCGHQEQRTIPHTPELTAGASRRR